MIGNPLADVLHLALGDAVFAQGLLPDRSLQTADHCAQQFLGRGDTENDRHARTVHVFELAASGIAEYLLGDDQRQQLAGVGSFDDAGRHAPTHGVEVDLAEETTAACVGLVRCRRISIVVILRQPVGLGNVGDQIPSGENIVPESGGILRAGEQCRHSYDRDAGTFLLIGVAHICSRVGVVNRVVRNLRPVAEVDSQKQPSVQVRRSCGVAENG